MAIGLFISSQTANTHVFHLAASTSRKQLPRLTLRPGPKMLNPISLSISKQARTSDWAYLDETVRPLSILDCASPSSARGLTPQYVRAQTLDLCRNHLANTRSPSRFIIDILLPNNGLRIFTASGHRCRGMLPRQSPEGRSEQKSLLIGALTLPSYSADKRREPITSRPAVIIISIPAAYMAS